MIMKIPFLLELPLGELVNFKPLGAWGAERNPIVSPFPIGE